MDDMLPSNRVLWEVYRPFSFMTIESSQSVLSIVIGTYICRRYPIFHFGLHAEKGFCWILFEGTI
jgi:hypothetical protein